MPLVGTTAYFLQTALNLLHRSTAEGVQEKSGAVRERRNRFDGKV
jgi:hypothetical protein